MCRQQWQWQWQWQASPNSEPAWQYSVTIPGSGRVMTARKLTMLGCLRGRGREGGRRAAVEAAPRDVPPSQHARPDMHSANAGHSSLG